MKVFGGAGDDFEAFVRRASTGLLRTAVLIVGDRGTAEDLVQVALMRTARRWSSAKDAPEAYAHRVLVNLTKDSWRNRARRPRTVTLDWDAGEPVGDPSIRLAVRDELHAVLAMLPTGQRTVLVLRYLEDLSTAEIADLLGCTEVTVRTQTHRALAKVRLALDPSDERETDESHV
jgi:RNA polymerase sigma-70 factor (sigma-E family)